MSAGLQIWDANGVLVLDLTDRLTRKMGEIQIAAGSASSVQVPQPSTGQLWFAFSPDQNQSFITWLPTITTAGNQTISWHYDRSGNYPVTPVGGKLRYGRF